MYLETLQTWHFRTLFLVVTQETAKAWILRFGMVWKVKVAENRLSGNRNVIEVRLSRVVN